MSLREEELTLLFETIEVMIERAQHPIFSERGHKLDEKISKKKQDCINLIAFGEPLDE